METAAGKKLSERLLERADSYRSRATMYAVRYAEDGKEEDRLAYHKYAALEKECRTTHSLVCYGVDEVESELRRKD